MEKSRSLRKSGIVHILKMSVVVGMMVGLSTSALAAAKPAELKIAVVQSLSGAGVPHDLSAVNAAKLLFEQINAAGGISGVKIKALVLDTEVYSNTGGQASKSTPMGAVARFAAGGKPSMKKDLGMISMTYGNIYVANVALGANPAQTVRAFMEAENYDGPALIVAYSHCIAHGIDMEKGMQNQKEVVACGHFPLYRYNPDLRKEGKNPLQLDSKPPTMKFSEQALKENRFRILTKSDPEAARRLLEEADKLTAAKFELLQKLAAL